MKKIEIAKMQCESLIRMYTKQLNEKFDSFKNMVNTQSAETVAMNAGNWAAELMELQTSLKRQKETLLMLDFLDEKDD